MIYKIWNILPPFLKRATKKGLLLWKYPSLKINNIKILDDFSLSDILNENISFGKNCFLGLKDNSLFGKIDIGDNTFIGFPNNGIYGCNEFNISIGKFCSIARNLFIINYNYHNSEKITTSTSALKGIKYNNIGGDIIIGNDVWIGANVSILPGVSIGNGVIIGTGSIITKNIPPYAISAGNPAKVLKYRFGEDKIQMLENSEWWNWNIEKIQENYNLNFLNEK